MTRSLSLSKVANDLTLPLDAVTRTFAVLAGRGAGKSNLAAVMAEEMFAHGLPFVAIDPVGSWYGLRSAPDGKSPGLPIPIFGGKYGDVPLERGSGEMIADLVVDKRLTCVLDISQFESEGAKKEFLLAFAQRLYRRNEDPLHLFLEEADDYIPQKPMGKVEPFLLRAWENIVRRGRARGLGMTMITQRSASINKNVLTQAETLFALRTSGPQDIAAIREWVKYHQVDTDLLGSLAGLADGEAWAWSPSYLKTVSRHIIRRRSTFDSGATPKNVRGDQRRPAATLADIDLSAIREKMAATIERAKENDPKALRAENAALKRALAHGPVVAEKDVKAAIDRAVAEAIRPYVEALHRKEDDNKVFVRRMIERTDMALADAWVTLRTSVRDGMLGLANSMPVEPKVTVPSVPRHTHLTEAIRSVAPKIGHVPDSTVTKGQQKLLDALAEMEALGIPQATRLQLGMFAGYNLTGGSGAQHIADLVTAGLVDMPDRGAVCLTDAGRRAADAANVPSTLKELHARVLAKLSEGQQRIAKFLISIYPNPISRADLGGEVGYNLTGGSGAQHVADLITVGAARIPSNGKVVASDFLFPDGLR